MNKLWQKTKRAQAKQPKPRQKHLNALCSVQITKNVVRWFSAILNIYSEMEIKLHVIVR